MVLVVGGELLEVGVKRLVLVLVVLETVLAEMERRRGGCRGEIAIVGIVQGTEPIDVGLVVVP
jgi:hypothetical protein